MEDVVRLVKDKAGNNAELIGYFIDVTERRNAQQDLLVKQAAMESSLNAIAMTGMDRAITYVNRAFVELWRLDGPEQAVGKFPREFIADAPRLVEITIGWNTPGLPPMLSAIALWLSAPLNWRCRGRGTPCTTRLGALAGRGWLGTSYEKILQ